MMQARGVAVGCNLLREPFVNLGNVKTLKANVERLVIQHSRRLLRHTNERSSDQLRLVNLRLPVQKTELHCFVISDSETRKVGSVYRHSVNMSQNPPWLNAGGVRRRTRKDPSKDNPVFNDPADEAEVETDLAAGVTNCFRRNRICVGIVQLVKHQVDDAIELLFVSSGHRPWTESLSHLRPSNAIEFHIKVFLVNGCPHGIKYLEIALGRR